MENNVSPVHLTVLTVLLKIYVINVLVGSNSKLLVYMGRRLPSVLKFVVTERGFNSTVTMGIPKEETDVTLNVKSKKDTPVKVAPVLSQASVFHLLLQDLTSPSKEQSICTGKLFKV